MNPLINSQMQNGSYNPMQNLMAVLQNGANPQQLASNILSNNPQAQGMLQSLQQQCGNGNPRDFVLNYCSQNGVDMGFVMSLANMLGAR